MNIFNFVENENLKLHLDHFLNMDFININVCGIKWNGGKIFISKLFKYWYMKTLFALNVKCADIESFHETYVRFQFVEKMNQDI